MGAKCVPGTIFAWAYGGQGQAGQPQPAHSQYGGAAAYVGRSTMPPFAAISSISLLSRTRSAASAGVSGVLGFIPNVTSTATSTVSSLVRDQEVVGSNPTAPTILHRVGGAAVSERTAVLSPPDPRSLRPE